MAYDCVAWGKFLFHIVHTSNLGAILKHGLLCKNQVVKAGLACSSIADDGIQQRRNAKPVPGPNQGTVHDYVPLFFAARPPMLLPVGGQFAEDEIVYLVIKWSVIELPGAVFTDGNAATASTTFYSDQTHLQHVDQDALRLTYWGGDQNRELRRRKGAEVLVWQRIDAENIIGFAVKSDTAEKKVRLMLPPSHRKATIVVAREWYYR